MIEKKRIVIDMDDVMADTSQSILDLYNSSYGTNYQKEKLLGTTIWDEQIRDKYIKVRHGLYEPGFFRNVPVMPGAIDVVTELYEKHDVFIVSAATEFPNSLKEKVEWLAQYFPFIHWQKMVFCGDKSIVKGDVMIDDHEKNLFSFKGQKLLFDAIHNQALTGYERVKNWEEIAEILL
ncbi:MAG: 5'-3'-deoxyribonucleotidase [Cytophagales bacterium]|nr:5'-3'-deoxyribonucleotidase [Cytophagales bacterium]